MRSTPDNPDPHGPQAGVERRARARLHRPGGEPGAGLRAGRPHRRRTLRQITRVAGPQDDLRGSGTSVPHDPERLLSCTGPAPGVLRRPRERHGSDDLRRPTQLKAKLTVQFLRGGMTTNGSRDEVLNQPSVTPPTSPRSARTPASSRSTPTSTRTTRRLRAPAAGPDGRRRRARRRATRTSSATSSTPSR